VNEAIVLLLLLWAVLLLPGALRSRNSSPHTTVGGFSRAMDVLRTKPGQGRELMVPGDAGRIVTQGLSRDAAEPAAGRDTRAAAYAPRGEDPVVARRRSWFLRLVVATAVGLPLVVAFGGWLWLPFTMLVLVTGGYVVLLRRLKLQHDQARRVVRELALHRTEEPRVEDRPEPADGTSGLAVGTVRLRRWDG
jgi:hypothetical protein